MFWISDALLVIAGINALIFYRGAYRTVASWDQAEGAPEGARAELRFAVLMDRSDLCRASDRVLLAPMAFGEGRRIATATVMAGAPGFGGQAQ